MEDLVQEPRWAQEALQAPEGLGEGSPLPGGGRLSLAWESGTEGPLRDENTRMTLVREPFWSRLGHGKGQARVRWDRPG